MSPFKKKVKKQRKILPVNGPPNACFHMDSSDRDINVIGLIYKEPNVSVFSLCVPYLLPKVPPSFFSLKIGAHWLGFRMLMNLK